MPYWQGSNCFVELADDCEDIPDLVGKSYVDFWLNKKGWEKMKLMHHILHVNNLLVVTRAWAEVDQYTGFSVLCSDSGG